MADHARALVELPAQCQRGSEGLDPQHGEASVYAVVSSLAINATVFVALACVFGVLLSHQRLRFLLAPNVDRALSFQILKPVGWVLDAWRFRQELYSSTHWRKLETSRSTDLDAAVILRFCIFGFKFSCCSTLVACFLLPLYASGNKQAIGFDRYNLSNLTADEAEKFTLVVLAAYAQVLMFLHFAVAEWRRFLRLRDVHSNRLARGLGNPAHGSGQAQRSVIVELVPQAARSQDGRGVEEFFNRLFPGAGRGVHSCVLQADTRLCYKDPGAFLRTTGKDSIAHLHQGLRRMRETNVATILQRSQSPLAAPTVSTRSGSPHGSVARVQEMVDAALAECDSLGTTGREDEHHRAFLGALVDAKEKLRARASAASSTAAQEMRALGDAVQDLTLGIREVTCHAAQEIRAFGDAVQDLTVGIDGTDTAFVTFWSVADRVVAEQLVLSHSGQWWVRAAPEARDVCWQNVPISYAVLKGRRLLARAGLVAGLIFWSVPVASIQLWTSLDAEPPSWADSSLGMFAFTVLRKNLPVLGLIALQYVLPEVLRLLTKQCERRKAKSEIDSRVLGRNIKFQFATLWVTVISSTGVGLHKQFECILQKPEFFFDVLRTEVPAVASFFLTFIATRVGLYLPVLLFRSISSNTTNFRPGKEMRPTHPDYPREATSLVLALVLGLTYSVLAPAIMPICAVFFGCAFLVYCWLFRHVYTPDYDGGGACWQHLFNASMAGLLVGTLTLAALSLNMLSSGYFYSLVALAALIVGSHIYMLRYFAYPSRYLSLEEACEVDRTSDSAVLESLREDYYVDPVLTAMESETPKGQESRGGDEVELPHEPHKLTEEISGQFPGEEPDRGYLESKDWLQADVASAGANEPSKASFDSVACTSSNSRTVLSKAKTSGVAHCPWIVCFPGQWRKLGWM